jgi:hypothetical protein
MTIENCSHVLASCVPFPVSDPLQCDMTNATIHAENQTRAGAKIYWGRIVLGAFLLEAVLLVTLVPLVPIFGQMVFFVAVPIGCFVFGFLFGMWVARKLRSGFILHGALMGILATLLYLGLCATQPGSIPAVVAVYGLFLFLLSNGLRIAGCIAGAFAQGRRRTGRQS